MKAFHRGNHENQPHLGEAQGGSEASEEIKLRNVIASRLSARAMGAWLWLGQGLGPTMALARGHHPPVHPSVPSRTPPPPTWRPCSPAAASGRAVSSLSEARLVVRRAPVAGGQVCRFSPFHTQLYPQGIQVVTPESIPGARFEMSLHPC